jgi:hypothetical protein
MSQKIQVERAPIQVLLTTVKLSRQICAALVENSQKIQSDTELVDLASGVLVMLRYLNPALQELEKAAGLKPTDEI